MNNLPFDTLHDAVAGVRRACIKASMPELHLFPYSRFSAEDSSLWWLCVKKTTTAFKQGKFVLGKPERFGYDAGILCGLHMERGVKQTVGGTDWKLAPDWKWHDFVKDMDHLVPDAVADASSIVAEPVDVFVFASTDGPKNFDRVRFNSSGTSLSAEETTLNLNVLANTALCRSWGELSTNLLSLPTNADWYWVDVFIVSRFSLDTFGTDNTNRCVKMLELLQPWLGSSKASGSTAF